jgi:transposase
LNKTIALLRRKNKAMANRAKSMQQIRQILQQYLEGSSIRQLVRQTGYSRNTIRGYLQRWTSLGLDSETLAQLDDSALGSLMLSESKITAGRLERKQRLESQLSHYARELKRAGVTRLLLWQEYRSEDSEGYGYTRFCDVLKAYLERSDAVMHFEHKAGERMMIDFAGKTLHYVDAQTGEQIECQVFVAVLPCSGYCYVEAVSTQNIGDFVQCIANSFHWFEGVPQSVLCDNLRSGVKRSDRYEPQFTNLLEQLGLYYNCAFMATRVRRPRDKASVERHVQIIYQRVYAPLRDSVFISLQELNAAIRERLRVHHTLEFQGRSGENRERLFREVEQPKLQALPAGVFEVKYTVSAKVQRNCHVMLGQDRHYYSVPWQHIGQQATLVYTAATVEVYLGPRRIAMHRRSLRLYGYTTIAKHLPPAHQHYLEQKSYTAQYFTWQASRIGLHCLAVVEYILSAKIFHEQAYNSCLGLLRLSGKYGEERLELACRRAMKTRHPNYSIVHNILRNGTDALEKAQDEAAAGVSLTPTVHENVRGQEAYRNNL